MTSREFVAALKEEPLNAAPSIQWISSVSRSRLGHSSKEVWESAVLEWLPVEMGDDVTDRRRRFRGSWVMRSSEIRRYKVAGTSTDLPLHLFRTKSLCHSPVFVLISLERKELITNFKNSSLVLTNFRKSYLQYFGDMCFKNQEIFNCFIPCFFMIFTLKPLFKKRHEPYQKKKFIYCTKFWHRVRQES